MVFRGDSTGGQYVHLSYSNDCRDTHIHSLSLSYTHLYLSLCLSLSPSQAIQVAHVVLSWLSKHNLVISHVARRRLAFPFNPRQAAGSRERGKGRAACSIKVCCGRQSISGLCCLHISHCQSAPTKPTRASQPQMGDGASSPCSSATSSSFPFILPPTECD